MKFFKLLYEKKKYNNASCANMRGLPSYYYFVYVDKAAKRAHMHETGQRTYGALHIYIYIYACTGYIYC